MRANFPVLSAGGPALSAAVVAATPADAARLSRLLESAAAAQIVYRGDLADFAARQGEIDVDLALLEVRGDLAPAHWTLVEALTRRTMLVIVGDASARSGAARMTAARAWAFVGDGVCEPVALADALAGLGRARASENRLLGRIADQEARIHRLAGVAGLVPPVLARVEDAIWGLAGLACSNALAGEAADCAARAFDAVDELAAINHEFAECVRASDIPRRLPASADLNRLVEEFVRDNAAASSGAVSAQTGCDPIPVKAAAAPLRELLEAVLGAWRETQQPGDKLELLAWDAGADARLAVVLTRQALDAAPAFIAMRNIFRTLHPIAQACGVDVEAGLAPSGGQGRSASMTICLAKSPAAMAMTVPDANLFVSRVKDRAG